MRLSATAVVIVMAWSTVTAADPRLLPPDADVQGRLTASSDRLPDGAAYDCYAIETEPGQQVTVTMRSQAFDSRLWVARGGQCASARLQQDNDDFEGRDARVGHVAVPDPPTASSTFSGGARRPPTVRQSTSGDRRPG